MKETEENKERGGTDARKERKRDDRDQKRKYRKVEVIQGKHIGKGENKGIIYENRNGRKEW